MGLLNKICSKSFLQRLCRKNINLIDRLPPVRGILRASEPLHKKNWFGVGGAAEVYFEPADIDDLSLMMRFMPNEPCTILGSGSNVLIRDGGIPGIVIHLGQPFSRISLEGETLICGAGASLMEIARFAEKNSIAGFEFMSGIPGSLGGGIRMNAGAFKRSLKDVLVSLTVMMPNGELQEVNPKDMEIFAYRQCYLPNDWVFVEARLRGEKVPDAHDITEKMRLYKEKREAAQPQGVRTAGSTFKNPDGLQVWKLIDNVGLRGAKEGGAMVSEKHANFLINTGSATAKDIETLGNRIVQAVRRQEGITLEWEIKKMGVEID